MYKLLRITLFALPLAGGVAWAQKAGTDDTRTPVQQKAGRIDDTTPALPGDATKPVDIPNTVQDSNRTGMPAATEKKKTRKSDAVHDTTKMDNKLDSDTQRDQLNSDK